MSTLVSSVGFTQNLRNRELWTTIADTFAILTAVALPWSTSLVLIFMLCWLGAFALLVDYRSYALTLRNPACFLPLAIIVLALVGTLWSDAPWKERFGAVSPVLRLIVIPGLFYHFGRSKRGMWVFAAFLLSCIALMASSWIVALNPELTRKDLGPQTRGIFVKNYIDQSQEFSLCVVTLIYPIAAFFRSGKSRQALLLCAVSFLFVLDMALVTISRTAMVTMPIMLTVAALLHLKWRTNLFILLGAIIFAAAAWTVSPALQQRAHTFVSDYEIYRSTNAKTSIGLRLEYWTKSLRFISDAPVTGHGTGSTRGLFEKAKSGGNDVASGVVINNPHNQTLAVAVQWGILGVVVLYAMWFFHLAMFRGEGFAAWVGLLVVVQNFFTSLFNSHLFDFVEGWMYVLGVGVAGGMLLRQKNQTPGRSAP